MQSLFYRIGSFCYFNLYLIYIFTSIPLKFQSWTLSGSALLWLESWFWCSRLRLLSLLLHLAGKNKKNVIKHWNVCLCIKINLNCLFIYYRSAELSLIQMAQEVSFLKALWILIKNGPFMNLALTVGKSSII